jgi:hypothetical protein
MYVQCKGNSSLTPHLFWQLVHNQSPKGCFSRRSCCSGSNRECRGFQCHVIRLSNHSFKSSPCTWVWWETETYLHLWCAHYSSDKCCILSLLVILSSFGVKCKCRWQESSTSCHQTDSKVGEMKTLGVGMLQMVTMSLIQLVFRSSNLH